MVCLNALRGLPLWIPVVLLSACEQAEKVVDYGRELTPHEAYVASLRNADLDGSALGRDWIRAAAEALRSPVSVPLPYREEGFLTADAPAAVGLKLALRRGQVLTVKTSFDAGQPARVFVDFYRIPERPSDPLRPLVRVDSLPDGMVYEPYRDGEYILRLQPELLRGGRYQVVLSLDPVLSFPVDGGGPTDIGSGFGADRDGGARAHAGVDIFAPRGTPALAASSGEVTRVESTRLGGLVVWVRDEKRGQNLYYAHLSEQHVTPGTMVSIGDTIGLVGNTGNARTTPPHLHFGVYVRGARRSDPSTVEGVRGAQDPMPYLVRPRAPMPSLPATPERLGTWARVSAASDGAPLLGRPVTTSDTLARLTRDTPVRLMAGSGAWWRVRLPDGRLGWLAASATEPAHEPIREALLAQGTSVRSAPTASAPVVQPLGSPTSLSVLGEFSGYLWVREPGGQAGWVPASD